MKHTFSLFNSYVVAKGAEGLLPQNLPKEMVEDLLYGVSFYATAGDDEEPEFRIRGFKRAYIYMYIISVLKYNELGYCRKKDFMKSLDNNFNVLEYSDNDLLFYANRYITYLLIQRLENDNMLKICKTKVLTVENIFKDVVYPYEV